MNRDKKIKQQVAELAEVRTHIVHYGNLVKMSAQALQYIASGGKNLQPEESKILLLNEIGIPGPKHKVTPPAVVATECLELLQEMAQKHREKTKPVAAIHDDKKTEIDKVRLIDGESIFFTTDFDVLTHSCCDCNLHHSVELVWSERDGNPVLETKWTRLDRAPTIEELKAKGEVLTLAEVKK